MNRATMVLTTIGSVKLLEGYRQNFEKWGHLQQVKVVVIPDRKTTKEVYEECALLKAKGLDVECPELDTQEEFLANLGVEVACDSDHRRNVGYLMALENGSDFMISLDDDNYCQDGPDYFAAHEVVCQVKADCQTACSITGWLNPLQGTSLYPRGYPYRNRRPSIYFTSWEQSKVAANEGSCIGCLDLDAMTWLNIGSFGHVDQFYGEEVALGRDTWCPINSQNTAVCRDAIAAYWFVRMRYDLNRDRMDRFGDIFQGYFLEACAKSVGDTIRVGRPVVDHTRNKHDSLLDAEMELPCIVLLEDLLPWLREQRLVGSTYGERYTFLSHLLDDELGRRNNKVWDDNRKAYFRDVTSDMRQWVKACEVLN